MNDCISRQAVLDGIEELKKSPWCTDTRGNGFEYLITEALDVVADLCVKQVPSVNPQEPKTGHWIDDEFGSKCSCCGIYTHLDKFDRPMKFKYCSMCGAKMVEPQESEET